MIPAGLLPSVASSHALAMGDHATLIEHGCSTPWGRFATLAAALSACVTVKERRLMFREAARRSRALRAAPALVTNGGELADWYAVLAGLAFRASRWCGPAPRGCTDLLDILASIPVGVVGPDRGEPVPADVGPEADEYHWMGGRLDHDACTLNDEPSEQALADVDAA